MAELEILTYPNPVLLAKAQVVARVSSPIQRLAHNMLETMYAASGIGLAAPQVGVQKRVIVVDVGEDPLVLVNPTIAAAEGEQLGLEGCLSLPDLGITRTPTILDGRDQGHKVKYTEAPAGREAGRFIWRPTLCSGTGRQSCGSRVLATFKRTATTLARCAC
jgi:peptide deformylase